MSNLKVIVQRYVPAKDWKDIPRWEIIDRCDEKIDAVKSMIESVNDELSDSKISKIDPATEKIEINISYRIMKQCGFCKDILDAMEVRCDCPESVDEEEQLLIDNAAEAKSERQRGH